MKRRAPLPFPDFGPPIMPDMARRRGAQKGYLYKDNEQWKLRWYEDAIGSDGKAVRRRARPYLIGRAAGPGKLTKKQAQRIQAEKMLEVNRGILTTHVTLSEFIERRFRPDHFATLTANGISHYSYTLQHVEAAFGQWELPEIKAHKVAEWLQAKAQRYSQSSVKHFRNTLHAVFEHAHYCGFYEGRNPAARAKIPRAAREPEPTQAYTVEELRAILAHLGAPLWEMFVLGASTSMHAAELCGLRVEHLNLTSGFRSIAGRQVPPNSLYVVKGKTSYRKRILPIPALLHEKLRAMTEGRPLSEPVFFMPRTVLCQGGVRPVNAGNITTRTFKPLGAKLGIKVNWHRLRATTATLTGQMLMDDATRTQMMGHGSIGMTRHYEDPLTKQRGAAEAIAEGLLKEGESVQ